MANAPKFRRLKGSEDRKPSRDLSASERGYDNYWTKVVAPAVRERDEWLCQQCLREGGLAQAMEEMMSRSLNKDGSVRQPPVDHIIPGHADRSRFYDMTNLETLCEMHNQLKTQSDAKKYGVAKR